MPINNNFIVQGTYTNNSNLSNILLNENVRTSSLITYNLTELIKSSYKGEDAVLNLEQQDAFINSCFSNSLENYIRQIIMDKYPSASIAGGKTTYNYTMFDGNQPNDAFVVTSDSITLKIINKGYNNSVMTEYVSLLLFYKYFYDDGIQTTLSGKTINIKHKVFQSTYPYDKNYGATDSMNTDGYDKSFPIAHFSCDARGHILSDVLTCTYTPPVRSYCMKELYSGAGNLNYISSVVTDDEIRYYTTLLITAIDENGYKLTYFVDTRSLAKLGNYESISIPFAKGTDCLFIKCVYSNGIRKYDFYSNYYNIYSGEYTSNVFKYLTRVVGLIYGHQKQDTDNEF